LQQPMNSPPSFRDRIDCWRDTVRRVEAAGPALQPPPSIKARFDPSLARGPGAPTRITVEDMDSIDCGLAYLAAGHRPVVLNLADECVPGGCVDVGSGAQEESLFRRTALCATLRPSLYPIADDEGIYSPDVAVLKASEADGWTLYDDDDVIPRLSFLTVPGVKYPSCTYGDDSAPRLRAYDEARLACKVRTMLQIASAHGHDVVVLGASGCGAWKCPPEHVAEVFARIVREFDGEFRVVAFAILRGADDNANAKRAMGVPDNYDVFAATSGLGARALCVNDLVEMPSTP
jgi:uncharacterized protein (TIGR02452 family)